MDKYVLHFFKENTRRFDFEKLVSFFNEIPEIKEDENNSATSNEIKFFYHNPILSSNAAFILQNKSVLRNLHSLDPRYLDVNFRLEIPITTTSFAAKYIFEIAKNLVELFDFHIYNELFNDVIDFRLPTIERSFDLKKESFKEKFSYKLENIYFCPKSKLNDILKYVNEQYDLQRYYRDQDVYVPNYYIVVDENDELYFSIQWQEGKMTVFPPHLDYVFYNSHNSTKTTIIPYPELIAKIERWTTNVPGFIENTKVIAPKRARKTVRILKKAKFTAVEKKLKRINLNQIIDF